MNELTHAEFLALKAKRDRHLGSMYCLRLLRALFASHATSAIGADAVMLVQWIALREDELRYSDVVRAWNEQLNHILGFRSPKQIQEVRKRAIAAGWLFYHRINDRSVGEYWVSIPSRFLDFGCPSAASGSVPNAEQEAEQKTILCSESGIGNGTGSGTPSTPSPIPSSSKKTAERFIPPSVQGVQEYAETKGLKIEAERFVDFYEAKGWMVGQNQMKNWQAAVRNWARSQRDQTGKTLTPQTTNAIEYVN